MPLRRDQLTPQGHAFQLLERLKQEIATRRRRKQNFGPSAQDEDEATKVAEARRAGGLSKDPTQMFVVKFCHPDHDGERRSAKLPPDALWDRRAGQDPFKP
jgi:hypothetical protein